VLSYVGAILVGTLLLSAPISWREGVEVKPVDALFTATSAVCVTGLIVKDTGFDFSSFGQGVILLLIQIGGLGLMTFSTFFVYLMGRRVGLRERVIVRDSFGDLLGDDPRTFVTNILKMTLCIEATGAILLYWRFSREFDTDRAAFLAVFHSISAFCNAGFSLFSTSFMKYRSDIWVVGVIVALIVVGGLGFLVLADIARRPRRKRKAGARPLSLHTKMVLVVSGGLIVIGTIACFFLEMNNTLADNSLGDRIMSSVFLSVTSRTAGFNTLDTSVLSSAALFVVMMLMFVGASPGSTGGGIKTTTFGIFLALARARLRGHEEVNLFRRTVPREVVNRSIAVFAASFSVVLLFCLALLVTERGSLGGEKDLFRNVAFETLSAFGTVGLSTGMTSLLTTAGRLLVSALMVIGRIGPLTMVMALAGAQKRIWYEHPREAVMIG
jgi:trk system potassium uptake protein TrkH